MDLRYFSMLPVWDCHYQPCACSYAKHRPSFCLIQSCIWCTNTQTLHQPLAKVLLPALENQSVYCSTKLLSTENTGIGKFDRTAGPL